MSHTPALDLSKYDLLEAKDKLFAYVCGKAESWGMDPTIECSLLSPSQSRDLGYGRCWRVMWEAGPYNWGIELSGGSVTFVAYDGPWDRAKPEVVLGDLSDWYLEPHYGFDVGFIPNTPYAEFYTEEADRAIVAVSEFVAVELMKEIARHPKILLRIERRQFENVIAELFSGFGYDVELTRQTRDGGKDIIAVKRFQKLVKQLAEMVRRLRHDGKIHAIRNDC